MPTKTTYSLADGRKCRVTEAFEGDAGLAVMLPGLNYSCQQPLLAGASELLQQRGFRVLELGFPYRDDEAFKALPDDERIAALERDGLALLKHILASPARSLVLVGKSLGTILMGGMVREMPEKARLVWLTPSLTGTPLLQRMQACPNRGLSLIGSEDVSVAITREADYQAIGGLVHVEVPGMDHPWHHQDGEAATRKGLFVALAIMGNWLDSSAQLDKSRLV